MDQLTRSQKRFLLENSIERVINSTITALDAHRIGHRSARTVELADQAFQDWSDDDEAIKQLVVQLWNEARNRVLISEMDDRKTS